MIQTNKYGWKFSSQSIALSTLLLGHPSNASPDADNPIMYEYDGVQMSRLQQRLDDAAGLVYVDDVGKYFAATATLTAVPTPGSNIDGRSEFLQEHYARALEGALVSPFPVI